eukprot:1157779-Pelagomonas_calceolata.AAC.26
MGHFLGFVDALALVLCALVQTSCADLHRALTHCVASLRTPGCSHARCLSRLAQSAYSLCWHRARAKLHGRRAAHTAAALVLRGVAVHARGAGHAQHSGHTAHYDTAVRDKRCTWRRSVQVTKHRPA